MTLKVVSVLCCVFLVSIAHAQKNGLNNFEKYEKLPGESYLQYLKKSSSTAVADTGGAVFIKIQFLAESDTVFIDVNKEAMTPSYPMRVDQHLYEGDFQYVIGKLHVGDSVKFYMSLDSLHKYYPYEFTLDDPWNDMRFLGMSIKVDSIYSRETTKRLQAAATAEQDAANQQLVYDDSVQLSLYLSANKYPSTPDYNGIWYKTLKEGSGAQVKVGDEVKVNYKYSYPDGKIIGDSTLTYIVGELDLVEGWEIGFARMKKGEKAIWIIPTSLAYNDGHTMIFEVKLLDIQHK
jgi:FKBP-type peptidyl-prolyl cis-trans isomerase FkpA